MTIRVDRAKCSGIGLCEVTAGQSRVLEANPAAGDRSAAEEAALSCPTGAILIAE